MKKELRLTRNEICIFLGSYIATTEEIMIALRLTPSGFTRFAKRTSLVEYKKIKSCKYYHVIDIEKAVRLDMGAFEIVDLIKTLKD